MVRFPGLALHDDKIILAGPSYSSTHGFGHVTARLTSDGSLDTCFRRRWQGNDRPLHHRSRLGRRHPSRRQNRRAGIRCSSERRCWLRRRSVTQGQIELNILTAADTTYTGHPLRRDAHPRRCYPADGSDVQRHWSVSFTFFADAAGTTEIPRPSNAGTYYVQGFFTAEDSCFGIPKARSWPSRSPRLPRPSPSPAARSSTTAWATPPRPPSPVSLVRPWTRVDHIRRQRRSRGPVPVKRPSYYTAMASFGGSQNTPPARPQRPSPSLTMPPC